MMDKTVGLKSEKQINKSNNHIDNYFFVSLLHESPLVRPLVSAFSHRNKDEWEKETCIQFFYEEKNNIWIYQIMSCALFWKVDSHPTPSSPLHFEISLEHISWRESLQFSASQRQNSHWAQVMKWHFCSLYTCMNEEAKKRNSLPPLKGILRLRSYGMT